MHRTKVKGEIELEHGKIIDYLVRHVQNHFWYELQLALDKDVYYDHIGSIVSLSLFLHNLRGQIPLLQWPDNEIYRERRYLKKKLHQLKHECEEIQESKRKLEFVCKYEFEWKLEELNCQLRKIESQRQLTVEEIACLSSLLVYQVLLVLCAVEDASRQGGGFRNFVLDGWWLEFWEIILLAAGDVERNPGPRQITDEQLAKVSDTPIEEDDLYSVFDAVRPVSSKWSRLCCSLGLRASLLDTIEKNHSKDVGDCLFAGLKHWILKNYDTTKHGPPSWRRLVKAVDNSSDNHALALKIAEEHKQSDVLPVKQGSVAAPIPAAVYSDPKKSQAMSTAFANMYRAISRLLQSSIQAEELKDHLRLLCHPQSFRQLCIDPRVYEGATSTKDILKELCPGYINPAELFILEGIVETFGSRQCKKLLRGFQDEFC